MLAVSPRHAQRFVAAVVCGLVACAHAPPASKTAEPARALLLPILWIPAPPENVARLDAAVARRWSEIAALELRHGHEPVESACADDLDCLRRLGREASVDTLVLYRVGRLGPTTVIRIQTFDVNLAAMEQTVQSVLEDVNGDAIETELLAATDQLAAFYREPPSWYERPTVWIAAAATVAAGVLTVIFLSRDDAPEPDLSVTPPPPR